MPRTFVALVILAAGVMTVAAVPPSPPAVGGRAVLPTGDVLLLEIADEHHERVEGLKRRPAMPPDRGMLFVFPYPAVHGFHMEDCLISLDLLWLDRAGRVLHIEPRLPPCEARDGTCPTWAPDVAASFVLELAGGRAAELGLEPGSIILLDW